MAASREQLVMDQPRTRLLVSVRNGEEAQAALAGGADLIDIKDPARGPLGCAIEQWASIVSGLPADVPLSAALGELAEWRSAEVPQIPSRIGWVKFGLAHQTSRDWQREWMAVSGRLRSSVQPVIVAYADWERCQAPPLEEVCRFAWQQVGGLLLDTYDKSGGVLWDHVTDDRLWDISQHCRRHRCTFAVAGSLTGDTLSRAAASGCDWVAVRGAACRGGRQGTIDSSRVRALRSSLAVRCDRNKTASPIA